ncbi:hypothetical protein PC119_g22100 [Phytophthora cactorum]|nr:hypothetical protein PC119_g22100 [Phytophthora cactorum]
MPSTLDKYYSHLNASKRESHRKRIYAWEKDSVHIEEMAASVSTAVLKSDRKKGTATTISTEGEEGLVEWVNSLRGEGVPVSRLMLQLQVKDIAQEEGVPEGLFEGSWCWQQGFLSRHGLSLRSKTRQGQKSPAAMEEAAREFQQDVQKAKAELEVDKVYNADQSGICFEYLPKQTAAKCGEKTVWVRCGGKYKELFTANPSKIPEKVVYNTIAQNGFGDTVWREIKATQSDLGVQIYGNISAWWNTELSVAFLDYHFASRDDDAPVLLLWDDISAHWTEEVRQHALLLNVHLMKVPPGLTSVCQPADIYWFRPLKQKLRKYWVQNLSKQLQDYAAGGTGSKFELKAPSRREAIEWATMAWKSLGPEELERLEAIEETVTESDDVVTQLIDESTEEK